MRLLSLPVANGEPRWVISGGIGSGKSAVRRLLDERDFFTVDADSVGHEVLARNGPAYRGVAARWPEVVDDDGEIDRSELGRIVFSDGGALAELERLTHPHIFGTITDRVQEIPDPVAVEIPLLKHGLGEDWSRLVVDCPDDIRLRRLIGRGMPGADAEARMAAQPSRGQWLAIADVVVPNHGDLDDLRAVVARWLEG